MNTQNNKMQEELLESIAVASGESVDQIKRKMEEIDERAKDEEQKKQQEAINKNFEQFLKEPIPDYLDELYEFNDSAVVIRMFDYEPPNNKSDLYVTLDRKASVTPYLTFSIAKVLIAGAESKYKKGDIVKLKDFEAKTLKNPRYEAWINNPYSKSNAKKVGEAPPEYLSQVLSVFGQKMFMVNPLSVDVDPSDWITFKIHDMNIDSKVKNPLKLLELNQ